MNQAPASRILVAMSGGVDSAVCAFLLKQQGYSTEGITMRLWSDKEPLTDASDPLPDQNCLDASAVAEQLGIPHHCISLGESFRQSVIDRFLSDYINGATPNPCVECNRHIKFGKLFDLARDRGFDRLATGHYARLEQTPDGKVLLKKATDRTKDQSYFLWSIRREALPYLLFPLGDYTKDEIREIAAANQLPCAHRTDSQDICFIPDGDYVSFIETQTNQILPCGNFVSCDGRVLGTHNGIIRYTVGQRKGLGIALGYPIFVGKKNAKENTVTLCPDSELYASHLNASSVNLLVNDDLSTPRRLEVKIRYRHSPAPALVCQSEEGKLLVQFDEPQRAIAPGQSAVLYDGDTLIGGGIIDSAHQ